MGWVRKERGVWFLKVRSLGHQWSRQRGVQGGWMREGGCQQRAPGADTRLTLVSTRTRPEAR